MDNLSFLYFLFYIHYRCHCIGDTDLIVLIDEILRAAKYDDSTDILHSPYPRPSPHQLAVALDTAGKLLSHKAMYLSITITLKV